MAPETTTKMVGVLLKTGLFSEAQVHELLALYKTSDESLTNLVCTQAYAEEDPFLQGLAQSMDLPFVKLSDTIPDEVLAMLPPKAVLQYHIIPYEVDTGTLKVATNDPFKPGLYDALRLASGKRIRFALSTSSDLEKAVKKFYGIGAETIGKMIDDGSLSIDSEEDLFDSGDIDESDEEASVVKFMNQIIWEAHQQGSTDIHIEPMEKDLRIRYRIDGVLHQTPVPPQVKRFQSAIIARIKVMAQLDIAEKRLPQDGRIGVRIKGEEIDIRVSTMPTTYGESVSLRLLMRSQALLGLANLGLRAMDEKLLQKIIRRPYGIILVTGPTGSGKSTSLYAYLNTINSVDKRIITAEDPIEYEMSGVNQVQMKPEIGLTFAQTLRAILRQDPDVIMVGEIRDGETAEIAIQAALTGHLVFSTLHTNDAASGFTRLLDMGVEPFLVASSIEALIAQRLVRRLCKHCRVPAKDLDLNLLKEVGFPVEELENTTIYDPVGCEECRSSGYSGRTGIYEVLIVNDYIRPLIVNHSPASSIKQAAIRKNGMRTLRDDGWSKVLSGVTTVEEVIRVSEEDEEQPDLPV
ncbi:MAG: ATPase, T2SS/T4P/T4SS family [Verrucomicrobiota bacterium]